MALETCFVAAAGSVIYAAGTPAFTGVGINAAPADTGTGDTLLTLTDIALGARVKSIQLTSRTAGALPRIGTVTAASGTIQVTGKQSADGTTATDCDFDILVICSRG